MAGRDLAVPADAGGVRRLPGDVHPYEIVIHAQFQRQGHARRAFRALEDKVRQVGLSGIALHVFGHNTGARALYESLGYASTSIAMFKPVV